MSLTVEVGVAPRYRQVFLCALIAATLLPAFIAFVNYEVTNQTVYTITLFLSLILAVSAGHTFLTFAYYTSREWLSHFKRHPMIFFVAPALVVASSTVWVAVLPKTYAMLFIYVVLCINIWHHSKQNWGILSLVGRMRSENVAGLRAPLVWAWAFFLLPFALQIPEMDRLIGHSLLYGLSLVCAGAYIVFCAYHMQRGRLRDADPVAATFAIALCTYFLPMIFLIGKPYGPIVWTAAHGAQYLLMVFASLSFAKRKQLTVSSLVSNAGVIAAILAGTMTVWYVVSRVGTTPDLWDDTVARAAVGCLYGVSLMHFWVDAFIWKFSERKIRELHGEAFAF